MRLLSSLVLLAPLALAKSYHAAQQPIQVYLHPTPAQDHHSGAAAASAPTLSADQAKAVLAHHLEESFGDFEELPQDEGMWAHLMGMWNGQAQREEHKPKVVIIQGGVDAQDVLPTSLSSSPSFYLEHDHGVKALLAPYIHQAESFLSELMEILPSSFKQLLDSFDMASSKAAAALGQELSCLTAMADNVPWLHDLKNKMSFDAVSISGLGQVDRESEEWETGRAGLRAGLAAMTTPQSPPLLLVIMPSSSRHHVARSSSEEPPMLSTTASNNKTAVNGCFSSNETCSDSTDCNGRGSCALMSKSGDKECWACKCSSGFAGAECQKTDYSVPFVILVFSTILLVGILAGSVMLLFSVGETKLPSTLTLAVGPSKRD